MNGLDICAGSGIGSWVWKQLGGRTVCYIENDDYCQRLLQARIADGLICDAPIWDDLRSFDARPWRGRVDFIFGGIPCQPWSVAGKQEGESDPRDLWPDFLRVLRDVEPRFALVENVPGLIHRRKDKNTKEQLQPAIGRLLGDLAESGYDAEWDCISASAVGAPHRRDRVWLVAYPRSTGTRLEAYRGSGQGREPTDASQSAILRQEDGPGSATGIDATGEDVAYPQSGQDDERDRGELPQEIRGGQAVNAAAGISSKDVADTESDLRGTPRYEGFIALNRRSQQGNWWAVEPDVGRVADGVASRVDRLKCLGNGWVPQVAEIVMRRILNASRQYSLGEDQALNKQLDKGRTDR